MSIEERRPDPGCAKTGLAGPSTHPGVPLSAPSRPPPAFAPRFARESKRIGVTHGSESDPDTLNYISRVVGTGEFEHRSETADDKGGAARTQASIYRELTPANVVREARRGTGLLVYGHLPPAKIRLRRPPKPRTIDPRQLPAELPLSAEAET